MIRPLLAAALCLPLLVPVALAQDETPEVVVGLGVMLALVRGAHSL